LVLESEKKFRLNFFPVPMKDRILLLKVGEIAWISSSKNYVVLHVGAESYMTRGSLDQSEEQLRGSSFVRAHRSIIVNLEYVRELQPWFQGGYRIVLKDGTKLLLGRSYRQKFFESIRSSSLQNEIRSGRQKKLT
jgi:DNA-binding LytR/AlgR family response regulator